MKTYTITLTEAEDKALHYVAVSAQSWIENVARHRAMVAMEEIVAAEVQRKLSAGETISGTKEDIVMAAQLESASERNDRAIAESEAELAARTAAQEQQGA